MTLAPRDGWPLKNDEVARAAGKESWAAWVAEIEAERGQTICGRRNQRGTPCQAQEASGVIGKRVGACKWHGGSSPAGPASASWIHGGRSASAAVVGHSLRERIEANMDADPRKMMALTSSFLLTRFQDLVEGMDLDAAGPHAMIRARELLVAMRATKDPAEMGRLLGDLEGIVKGGAASVDALEEFYKLVPLIGQHAERYRKVMESAGEYVERERALLLFDRFGRDVADHIRARTDLDDDQKHSILRALVGIVLSYTNRQALPPAQLEG